MDGARRKGGRQERTWQDVLTAFLTAYRINGLRYHCLLAHHLTRKGFEVRHVERQNNHADVWVLRLRRGQVRVGHEVRWVQKQVCRFLKRHGLRYPRREVVVVVQGDRITAAFNWSRGKPGWLSYYKPKAGRGRRYPA